MSKMNLQASLRELKEKRDGKIPAILYGKGIENKTLWVDAKDFIKVYREVGESTLLDLSVEKDGKQSVLIHDIQTHPLTGEIIHIDFYQVKMDEKIETDIELVFVGVAPAVKELGGTFVKSLDKLPIRALPGDLVGQIEVDISGLATFDDHIYVKDLNIPEGIEPLIEEDTVVALVTPPRSQAEMDKLDEEVDGDISQVEGMEDKDGVGEGESAEGKEATAEDKPADKADKEEGK
jgi:large subunit ribosomal protein L25